MSYMKRALDGSGPVTPAPIVRHCCTRCGAERMVLHVSGEERVCDDCAIPQTHRAASPDVEQENAA